MRPGRATPHMAEVIRHTQNTRLEARYEKIRKMLDFLGEIRGKKFHIEFTCNDARCDNHPQIISEKEVFMGTRGFASNTYRCQSCGQSSYMIAVIKDPTSSKVERFPALCNGAPIRPYEFFLEIILAQPIINREALLNIITNPQYSGISVAHMAQATGLKKHKIRVLRKAAT